MASKQSRLGWLKRILEGPSRFFRTWPALPTYLVGIHVAAVLGQVLTTLAGSIPGAQTSSAPPTGQGPVMIPLILKAVALPSAPSPVNTMIYDITLGPYLTAVKVLTGGAVGWPDYLPLVGIVLGAGFVHYYRRQYQQASPGATANRDA